jgi:hypothetical protein
MKMLVRIALTVVCIVISRPVFAQPVSLADDPRAGLIAAGAFIGLEFENVDNALLLGADGRIGLGKANLEINPRYTYRPFDDGSMQQLDVNFITHFKLLKPGRVRPFSGFGLGINRHLFEQFDSETNVGLNLVSGARILVRSGGTYEPFVQAQYTIFNEALNSFTLVVGTSFSFR